MLTILTAVMLGIVGRNVLALDALGLMQNLVSAFTALVMIFNRDNVCELVFDLFMLTRL